MSERRVVARRWAWRVLKVAVLALVVGGVLYWVRFAPISVTPHRIERGEIVSEVMGTGTLGAHIQTTISSKISGRIAEVLVDQGSQVQAGELLVRLYDDELEQQVTIAEANRDAAGAGVDRLETDRDRALAVFEQAERSYARLESLVARNAASQESLERAMESRSVAQAELSRAESAITEGQKEMVAAERTLEYHRARLADTEIQAPFAGLIVRRQRNPGDVVVPGGATLTLIATDELWIHAWVDETQMDELRENQPARVVFRSEADGSYSGSVVRLGREVDRETREFIVDVRVLELPKNWAVGQRAEVYIETDRNGFAVLLPAKYVVRRADRTGVFVERHGRAAWTPLVLGLRGADALEVVDGLEPGDVVMVPSDPRKDLRPGRRIAMQ